MRALGAVMALSCAVILAPSYAYADSVGMHVARIACGLDIDGVDQRGDRTDRDSVAALSSEGQASINEHSPEVSDSRGDHDGDEHDDEPGPVGELGDADDHVDDK